MRRGWIVEVEFFDHVCGGKRPMRCTVYGKVRSISGMAVVIDTWIPRAGRAITEANTEGFTIVRSAISKVTRLRREGA